MRSFFLRLRSIIIALFFIVVLTGFLVLPEQVIRLAEEIDNQEQNIRLLSILMAVLADFVLLYIIWQELRSHGYHDDRLIVKSRAASAEVTLESVQKNLEVQLQKLDHLYAVHADVRNERGRVIVEAEIDVDESVNVPKKTSEIHREIKKVVERQMGLKLGDKPQIRFRLMSQPTPPARASGSHPAVEAKSEEKRGKGLFGRGRDKSKPEKPQPADPDSVTARPSPPMPGPPPTQNFFGVDPHEGHITDKIPIRPPATPRFVPLVNDSEAADEDDES